MASKRVCQRVLRVSPDVELEGSVGQSEGSVGQSEESVGQSEESECHPG